MDLSLAEFCRLLPKVELHAHLNGSLRYETLNQLYQMIEPPPMNTECWKQWMEVAKNTEQHSLQECFQLFSVVQSLTSTPDTLFKGTEEVIRDFALDGVVYLELRSTPREVPGIMTKAEYIKTIAEAILKSHSQEILVKLIISIDRRQGREAAEENLRLTLEAKAQYPNIIVGIDLSGDPHKGDIDDFLPVLKKAQNSGLRTAVHCAEVPNEEEAMKILLSKPDRLGHGTCLHSDYGGSEKLWKLFLDSQIPLEICLTSNVRCTTVSSYSDHHVKHILSNKHHMTLATDDKGIFNTSLSKEWRIAAENFNLHKEDLVHLSLTSADYGFCSEHEKMKLKELISRWIKKYG